MLCSMRTSVRISAAGRPRAVIARARPEQWAGALAAAAVITLAGPSFARVPEVTTSAPDNVGFLTDEEIDIRRDSFGVLRGYDGKVAIQNKKTKAFWDTKCDLKAPGTLLMREPGEGNVYVLKFETLKQIDLSDDEVVAAIAADAWEKDLQRVEGPGEKGGVEALQMLREEFYQLVSIVDP